MGVRYRLTPELRRKLKNPIGTLIRGPFNHTLRKIKDLAKKENPSTIISVGDIVSKNLTKDNLLPKLSIVDNKVMRKKIHPIALKADMILHTENPPGTIMEEAFKTVQEALKYDGRVKVVVEGEEDLLTLPAILFAPENSFVVYGQPFEGMVVVKVTEQKKAEVTEILDIMESFRKAK